MQQEEHEGADGDEEVLLHSRGLSDAVVDLPVRHVHGQVDPSQHRDEKGHEEEESRVKVKTQPKRKRPREPKQQLLLPNPEVAKAIILSGHLWREQVLPMWIQTGIKNSVHT